MQLIRLPPGKMSQIIQIRNRSALKYLDHEAGIDTVTPRPNASEGKPCNTYIPDTPRDDQGCLIKVDRKETSIGHRRGNTADLIHTKTCQVPGVDTAVRAAVRPGNLCRKFPSVTPLKFRHQAYWLTKTVSMLLTFFFVAFGCTGACNGYESICLEPRCLPRWRGWPRNTEHTLYPLRELFHVANNVLLRFGVLPFKVRVTAFLVAFQWFAVSGACNDIFFFL